MRSRGTSMQIQACSRQSVWGSARPCNSICSRCCARPIIKLYPRRFDRSAASPDTREHQAVASKSYSAPSVELTIHSGHSDRIGHLQRLTSCRPVETNLRNEYWFLTESTLMPSQAGWGHTKGRILQAIYPGVGLIHFDPRPNSDRSI